MLTRTGVDTAYFLFMQPMFSVQMTITHVALRGKFYVLLTANIGDGVKRKLTKH